eukprot:TRINITY_DN901_c0_g2_i4.p1 TRINITY_DN901_c0_g2~~TRINITY_DN901_c0_g2_i4.p1  ORF type:complete len:735 (+),score=145.78 TRINITY_DN901_c0_g2_i4:290-2206(+)
MAGRTRSSRSGSRRVSFDASFLSSGTTTPPSPPPATPPPEGGSETPPPAPPPRPPEPVAGHMVRGQSFMAHWMAGMQRYRLEVTERGALCEVRAGPSEGSALRGTKREYDGVAVDKVQDGWLRLAEGTGWVRKHGPLWRWVPMGTEAGLMPRGGTQVPGGFRVGQRVRRADDSSPDGAAPVCGEVVGPGAGPAERVRVRWDGGEEAEVKVAEIELDIDSVTLSRAPTMVWDSQKGHLVPPQDEGDAGKYTVVFDLDETLIFARRGPLFARPGIAGLLALLDGRAEVIVWTAGMRGYAQAILRQIDPHGVVRHCVYRHPQWHALGSSAQRKDLAALGRDLDRTLIVENSADSIRGDEANAVLLSDYEATEAEDRTLPALTTLLRHLLVAQRPVPAFLAETELLSRQEVACESGTAKISAWVLDPGKATLDAVDREHTGSGCARPLEPMQGAPPPVALPEAAVEPPTVEPIESEGESDADTPLDHPPLQVPTGSAMAGRTRSSRSGSRRVSFDASFLSSGTTTPPSPPPATPPPEGGSETPPPAPPPRPPEPVAGHMVRGQSFMAHWMAGMQRGGGVRTRGGEDHRLGARPRPGLPRRGRQGHDQLRPRRPARRPRPPPGADGGRGLRGQGWLTPRYECR